MQPPKPQKSTKNFVVHHDSAKQETRKSSSRILLRPSSRGVCCVACCSPQAAWLYQGTLVGCFFTALTAVAWQLQQYEEFKKRASAKTKTRKRPSPS